MCGNCCAGSTGSVTFSDDEARAMAEATGLSIADFYENYTRIKGRGVDAQVELKEVKQADGTFDCVFLDRSKIPGKAICSLYSARPLQCRTWPWWPEILESPGSWDAAKLGIDGCPGLGSGQIHNISEITRQLNETLKLRGDCI
jgi:uncharacterized protein